MSDSEQETDKWCFRCGRMSSQDYPCQCDCTHDDYCEDERICLVCEKDITEELMARSYDYAKGSWENGY